ncbi:MAG: hypothetical protein AAGA66_14625, partial [Bacteroidota bacterium]
QKWKAIENNAISGNMEFLPIEKSLQDWKDNLYYEEDLELNDMIQYYKPFDLISETVSCGFMITPDYISKSIYYHHAPNPETYDLDIDFEGYMQMAYEAKIFQYWPKVLLDIQAEDESEETKVFKENMPRIFDGFDWNQFVKKYESLRLSNK